MLRALLARRAHQGLPVACLVAAATPGAPQWLRQPGRALPGACQQGPHLGLPRGGAAGASRGFSAGSSEPLTSPVQGGAHTANAEAEAEDVLFVADRLLGEGDLDSAAATLEAGVQRLSERYGLDAQGLLPMYGQLALLRFVEGDYEGAMQAAQRCYFTALQREGEGSRATLPHAVRFGVMLLASGDADGALPLLQSSGRRLELLVAELGAVAGALEPRSTGLAELQGMMEQLFDHTVALGEATFYQSLARIARNGGASKEVVLKAEEGLLEGLEMLKHSLEADHLIVGAALREHGRLVQRSLERGQKLAHIELALQNKRLHDAVRAAGFEYTTEEDERWE